MYYTDEIKNAQLAVDSFEVVLERSKEKEELVEASNGKTQGWWWKLVTEGKHKLDEQNEDFPLHKWTKSVAAAYPDNGIAVAYHAMSFRWRAIIREESAWCHLAWRILRIQQQTPPPVFHLLSSRALSDQYIQEDSNDIMPRFENIPMLLSATEHLELFATTTSLKDVYIFQRVGKSQPRVILIFSTRRNGPLGERRSSMNLNVNVASI
ncbi:hypothetical protein CPB86DRAFT_608484 [Serendipita vermifera]|nr:hypothetical protein CPB86DRAFT_608484 [Serendipita vermifera]